MNAKLIKNEADHRNAVKRLEELMSLPTPAKGAALEELELLAFLIESYEKKHVDISPPSPIEAIRFRMEQEGLRQQDLVPYIGSKSRVSEVLSGKRPLTLAMIRQLHKGLDIPADVLLQEPGEALPERIHPKEFPVRQMHKLGWFPEEFGDDWKKAKDRDEEMLHSFFKGRHKQPLGVLNRQQPRAKSKVDYQALHAWRCRAIDLASAKDLPAYRAEDINDEFIKKLTLISSLPEGPKLAIEALEDRGIAVVLLERLDGTHLDGAAMLLPDERPVIGLTLRYNRLDNFWFCLFHELGHVVLHLEELRKEPLWDTEIDKTSENTLEREADRFALESFISSDDWEDLKDLRLAAQIKREAKRRSIHPSIIAGRLRRESQDYRRHRTLIGQGELHEIFDW